MKFYVYVHRRNDTGAIFYVGKGCGKRATKKLDRSDWWKSIEAKHGRTIEIIKRGMNEQDAFDLEQWIIESIGRDSLCNLRDGGSGGIEPSAETRRKMSEAKKGRKPSEETKEKMRIRATGFRHSDESKAKIKAARSIQIMRPMSEEAKEKISKAKKRLKRSAEHCAAISAGKTGKKIGPMSDSAKESLRKANLGKKHSEESKQKMRESSTGKKHTPEAIAKLTESNRRLNAARRKPVLCSNGMIFEFSGAAQQWLRDNGYPSAGKSNITSCCTGKLKTAYGFSWQFADSSPA